VTPGTHTCPGLCGRELQSALFACARCTRRLPSELQIRIVATFWGGDWAEHSRAMTDAMHHYTAALRGRRRGNRGGRSC
jgi:hypothetical protein